MPHVRTTGPRVVVIGAGVVGCALADELTERGWTDVTVVDQGPLPAPGGSSSHAPGLVFQTNASRTMTAFARQTVEKLSGLEVDGAPCFHPVGGLEVATTPERLAELHRRHGWATSWALPAEVLSPQQCAQRHPLLPAEHVLGGLWVASDGLAEAVLACEAQSRSARARGARFLGAHRVTGVTSVGGVVTGVDTDRGHLPADVVVSCAGFWGPALGAMVGQPVPLVPLAHQYATTHPVPAWTGRHRPDDAPTVPILRHQDQDLYVRQHGDRVGVGSYAHRPMPVTLDQVRPVGPDAPMPSVLPFTPEDFAPSWKEAVALLPELEQTTVDEGMNGLFSFTADGAPLIGESRQLRGFWLAEAVWVTHSVGVARAVAELLTAGRAGVDVSSCDLHRFTDQQLAPSYVHEKAQRQFVEVYDVLHPLQPSDLQRGLRTSPFTERQRELGAHLLESGGWERPAWYEANAGHLAGVDVPPREGWAGRHWSPVSAVEARAAREAAVLVDMTPLTRLEVAGPGALALLQRLTTNQIDRPVGAVTYTLRCDEAGGVLSDLTVTRLAEDLFWVGANGPLDTDALREAARGAHPWVTVRDVTGGTCGVGLWGPRARDVAQPLTATDLSETGLRYFRAVRTHLGAVPVTMLRVSYVGELGWEVYTSAEHGRALWDLLMAAGAPHGLLPAGRAAFESLRQEKGYRAWGTDVTPSDDPYESGLGFAVKPDKGPFVGREALAGRSEEAASRRLVCLVLDDPRHVVLGSEPVSVDGRPVGWVTSAAFGHTVGRCVAHAWLPAALAGVGQQVEIAWFDRRYPATVCAEPLVDPAGHRVRGRYGADGTGAVGVPDAAVGAARTAVGAPA